MKNENPYREAMCCVENAREQLKFAGIEDKYYIDEKYVKSACGIAYSGTLKALDILFDYKNVKKQKGRKSIEYYRSVLSSLDKKLLKVLNSAYHVLHLEGYYEGESRIDIIKGGFDSAVSIIETLKPYSKNGVN